MRGTRAAENRAAYERWRAMAPWERVRHRRWRRVIARFDVPDTDNFVDLFAYPESAPYPERLTWQTRTEGSLGIPESVRLKND